VAACAVNVAGVGDWRLKLASASFERGRCRSYGLEAISSFTVGVGDGAGEEGRLDGLKNEGALMACMAQCLDERAAWGYVVVDLLIGVGNGMVDGWFLCIRYRASQTPTATDRRKIIP